MNHVDKENSAEFNAVLKDIPKISLLDVLKDAHIRKAFATFNETQVSTGTFLMVAILITLCAVVFLFRFRAFLLDPYTKAELVGAFILMSIQVFLIVILWIIWYLKNHSSCPNKSWAMKIVYKTQPALQVILPIGVSVFYGLQLLMRVNGGQCDMNKLYLNMLMCNPNNDTNGLPEETLAQLMLMPIVFHIILRDSLIGTFYVSYLVSFASILIAAFMVDIKQIMPFIAIYFFFSTVIHYDNQRQNLSLFFLAEKLKYSLSENERLADETHASELRHMIANVAHDLKTPLTSFLSGVEFITQIVMDWDDRLSDPSKALNTTENVEFASESLTAIHGCLESIRNTNSFMIMTINRCIDFTKASKGLKLVPKLETIDLQETVDLPIKVMRDFKSHLAINMLPIASDICSHVISDRQWLQENLLCLMSNAVKYSSKGTVEICVTLVTLPIIKPVAEVVAIKPSQRKKKNSLNKGGNKVVPDNVTLTSSSKDPQSPTNAQLNSIHPNNSSSNSNNNNNPNTNGNISTHSSYSLTGGSENAESFKVRKLSNFVFNHDYSTMGRSRIFSEKMLADINKEEEEQQDAIEEEGEEEEEDEDAEEGLFLKIEVQDTGIGLSKEAMSSLFTPFKQAQRLAGGTGLGLYSLAKRIEALCGHYGVSNRRDRTPGSLFWFAIPYRPDNVFAQGMMKQNKARNNSLRTVNHVAHAARIAAMRAVSEKTNSENALIDLENPPLAMFGSQSRSNNSLPSEPSAGPSSGRPSSAHSASSKYDLSAGGRAASLEKLSILLVDDSLSILKMTTMMLKRSGHKVEQADNGAEGLDLILRGYERMSALGMVRGRADTPYDVVLMDLQMPVMDGLESVRRLRAAEKELTQGLVSFVEGDFSGDLFDSKDEVREYQQAANNSKQPSKKVLSNSTVSDRDSRKTVNSNSSGAHAGAAAPPRLRRQFVIGVSANSDHGTMMEAMKAGFDAFIGKPFSIDSFYEVLQSHQMKEKERERK